MASRFVIFRRYSSEVVLDTEDGPLGSILQRALRDGVDLRGSNLTDNYYFGSGYDLAGIDLSGADLRDTRAEEIDFRGAVFYGANLTACRFSHCDFRGADFGGADLREVSFYHCRLDSLFEARLSIAPAGDIIGWKKCCYGVIAQLLIPAQARRSNAVGRKCRAEYVKVLALLPDVKEAFSLFDSNTVYRVGETVSCRPGFNGDRYQECSSGIHFFLTEEEAREFTF
jgi:hypothetical protein